MITIHQFLPLYPIDPGSGKLIVGTIHPHDHSNFRVPFFYGNRGSIWSIIHEAFPDELADPYSKDAILAFLKNRKISMSDVVVECRRKAPTALDSDLIPTKLNFAMIEEIRNSMISEIYFTSGFGANNAFKLFFVDILKQKLTKEIVQQKKCMLGPELFGRPVRLMALVSPAGTGNISLSKSKMYLDNRHRYVGSSRPVQDFKVDYYRQVFSN